jgi:hypothetical protein
MKSKMRLAEHIASMGEMRNACDILVWKPEGKRPLGRTRRRWEDVRLDLSKNKGTWLKTGTSDGPFKHGNKPSTSKAGAGNLLII